MDKRLRIVSELRLQGTRAAPNASYDRMITKKELSAEQRLDEKPNKELGENK